MERRLAAILVADVVDYSLMIGVDEEGTLTTFKTFYETMISPQFSTFHGRLVKLMGDGILAEFPSVVDAVTAAVKIQKSLANHNAELSQDRRMIFRIGINLGEIVIDGDDIHGDGVNVAARLESIAPPGGMSISQKVYDEVRNRLDIPFRDQGKQKVKNIERPVRVWNWTPDLQALSDTAPISPTQKPALPDKPSLVVLPFDNMSGDEEQEYFSDGISEDIITDLSKASGLFVIARNSAFVFKGKKNNIPDVCRELGVKFALEGSVRKAGNRVRINAQLIDGTTGGHLWAERYDRDLTDIFAVQDEVTQQIVSALKVTLNEGEKSLISIAGTRSVEAHDLFLRGRELIFGFNPDLKVFEQVISLFQHAIELDADYSAPYAALGMGYVLNYINRWRGDAQTSLSQARIYVNEAIRRNERDAFAYFVSAVIAMWEKDHDNWAQSADKALALNPNYALALDVRGTVFIYSGEPAKAIPYIERCIRLNPIETQQALHFLGTAYLVMGDYETAATVYKKRLILNPTTDLSRAFLASALGHMNQIEEAQKVWRELKEINPQYSYDSHISKQPFKDQVNAEKITAGLRKAGLVP